MEFGSLVSTSNEMANECAEVEVSDPVLWTFDIRPEEKERKQQVTSADDHVDDLRAHTFDHRDELKDSQVCGCFHCLAIFSPSDIKSWIDSRGRDRQQASFDPCGDTAVCPACSSNSTVLGSSSGFSISRELLSRLKALTS